MKLLDLFCGAGGAGMGYHHAGFEVIGIDIAPQKNYPFQFIQADALEYLCEHWQEYDVIHASPPCQKFSRLNRINKIAETALLYPDLIGKTRMLLRYTGKPYIIENVEGAPLLNPITLCGSFFDGLKVYRHRIFETNFKIPHIPHIPHRDNTPPSGQGVSDKGFVSITSGGIDSLPDGWTSPAAYKNMAISIDWMTQKELAEAIPPQYTQYIAAALLKYLGKDFVAPQLRVNKQLALAI